MRACTCCTGNAGELQPLSTLIQTHGNLNCCVSVLALTLIGFDASWLKSDLCSLRSLCRRKLIFWVCQTAMRALRAAGSCYHSQVRHADRLTMTAEPGRGVCMYVRGCDVHTRARVCVCVAPARRQKFVNGCRDCRHTWDSSGFQTTGDKTGGREAYKREGLSARVIHSATGTGAIFHKIKAPLFEEHAALQPRCTGNNKRQQRRAASGCPCVHVHNTFPNVKRWKGQTS